MLRTPKLNDAIETLYEAFRNYELRSTTDSCSCCHSPEDELRLQSKPLNKLSGRALRIYAMDAIYTWGTGDDFKHFIPRLFELLADGLGPETDFVHPADVFYQIELRIVVFHCLAH